MSFLTYPGRGNSENVVQKCLQFHNNGVVGGALETCSVLKALLCSSQYVCFGHGKLCLNHMAGRLGVWLSTSHEMQCPLSHHWVTFGEERRENAALRRCWLVGKCMYVF